MLVNVVVAAVVVVVVVVDVVVAVVVVVVVVVVVEGREFPELTPSSQRKRQPMTIASRTNWSLAIDIASNPLYHTTGTLHVVVYV